MISTLNRWIAAGLAAVLLVSASGCGSGVTDNTVFANASGTVNYKGQPLSGALVSAYPETGPVATGVTDSEGRFTLSSGADHPGVAVGNVRVTVTKNTNAAVAVPEGGTPSGEDFVDPSKMLQTMKTQQETTREAAPGPGPGPGPGPMAATKTEEGEVPAKFANPDTSGLSFEIKEGQENTLPIVLQ